jgi:hypothetical protein
MNVGITPLKRFYATAMALLFCAGFMGESLHYAWVAHERCAAHGELVHETHHTEPSESWHKHEAVHSHEHAHHADQDHHTSHSHDAQSKSTHPKINSNDTDAHDHCSLCDFGRDDIFDVEFINVAEMTRIPRAINAGVGSASQDFLPIALLSLAPKHAPPGFTA